MFLVGLTGGIGSGKSTVARLLADRGAVVVDADAVAREVVEPGQPAFRQLVERFGQSIVGSDGALDRPALAALVFDDEQARADLNAITHPAVGGEITRRIAAAPPDAVVVVDVPLLAEAKLTRLYEMVLVVEAPRALRLERLEERGLTRADAEARMAVQATDEERRAIADVVVDNSGDLAALEREVARAWAEVARRKRERETDPSRFGW
ncbi:MAG: dephospho-CoA kinase [Acidimicrobiia bacterium]